jgi:Fe-S-cluster-containing dehydrogenase component
VHACAEAHEGVTRLIRDGLRFDNFLVATSCRQCTDPMCMIGCPVGSIRRRDSLEVIIEDWCIGCDKCAKNCPYGNISMHEFDVEKLDKVYDGQKIIEREGPRGRKQAVVRKATTCDLCLDLPEPSCVYACPHNAAVRGNPSDVIKQRVATRSTAQTGNTAFIPLARLRSQAENAFPQAEPKKNWFSLPWRRKPPAADPKPADVPEAPPENNEPRWQPFK